MGPFVVWAFQTLGMLSTLSFGVELSFVESVLVGMMSTFPTNTACCASWAYCWAACPPVSEFAACRALQLLHSRLGNILPGVMCFDILSIICIAIR